MMEIITNPWVIGIGGGIISGLVVFLITNRIFSKKENREYQQKIEMANKELLYSIRPLIVGQNIPNQDLIDSIIYSTARKYSVKINDLYENEELAEDLTKEILDNPFLNSENKLKYCELTAKLKELDNEEITEQKREVIYVEKEKPITKEFFSITLAIMTTITVVIAVTTSSKLDFTLIESDSKFEWPILIALITLTPIIALTLTKMLKTTKQVDEIRKLKSKLKDNIEKNESEEKNKSA
ncbi:hypothetical protein [Polaribacter sp. 11A2H]|uniref:hypothetical protein n=1 Tax=Polaribacter sp. 11A2H TaxID=2687290 RepID=UPI001408DDBB|nr:hypothetical protein [Polaribacter sp. 11A2H]